MRILLIEDDERTGRFVEQGLVEAGHVVDWARTGSDGLFMAGGSTYDVLVVDRMLPEKDGLAIIGVLRATDDATPVLVLSALASVDDRVKGLKAGGDDYLTKPFAFSELQARIEALARRRSGEAPSTVLEVGDLRLDLLSRGATRAGQPIALLPREFKLLEVLMRHADQVVTRTMLLELVWDYHFDPQTNVVDVHIARLRQKIDKPFAAPLLHTVRGAGYRMSVDP